MLRGLRWVMFYHFPLALRINFRIMDGTGEGVMQIISVFNKWLGMKARELIKTEPGASIIDFSDFPEGAPIHEDGSAEYDPRKPLVLFALRLKTKKASKAWNEICADFDSRFAV